MADQPDDPQEHGRMLPRNGGSVPVPDPTELTRIALTREVSALREILEEKINGDLRVLETRLGGMDQAIKLVREMNERVPSQVDKEVHHLKEIVDEKLSVVNEKFRGVDTQFLERDQRTRDSRTADAAALAAALQAAKEAVGEANKAGVLSIDKLASSTSEQIKQGVVVADTNFRAIGDKIDAIDKRVTRSEGQGQGQGQTWGYVVGGIGLFGALIAIFFALAGSVPR